MSGPENNNFEVQRQERGEQEKIELDLERQLGYGSVERKRKENQMA
jgi:hypothetical protein